MPNEGEEVLKVVKIKECVGRAPCQGRNGTYEVTSRDFAFE